MEIRKHIIVKNYDPFWIQEEGRKKEVRERERRVYTYCVSSVYKFCKPYTFLTCVWYLASDIGHLIYSGYDPAPLGTQVIHSFILVI